MAKDRYIEFQSRMALEGKEFNISEGEFIDQYIGTLRSSIGELVTITAFLSMVMWGLGGGSDDDKTGIRKYLARCINKWQNDFAFYYSPSEFTKLVNSPIPMVRLLTEFQQFGTNTIGQMYGFATNDEDMMEKNHPLTILGKIMPITREAQSMYALFDDDYAKEWGLQNK